jgi:hypothetical protein
MIKAKFESSQQSRRVCMNSLYFSRLIRLLKGNRVTDCANYSDTELAARATVQNYEDNLKLIQILAQSYGFKAYFFWQPVLAFGDKTLAPFEKKLKEARKEELGGRVYRALDAVYQQAESRSSACGSFVFLGHAFDNTNELIYVGEFHLDPHRNRMMAHTIATTVGRGATSR